MFVKIRKNCSYMRTIFYFLKFYFLWKKQYENYLWNYFLYFHYTIIFFVLNSNFAKQKSIYGYISTYFVYNYIYSYMFTYIFLYNRFFTIMYIYIYLRYFFEILLGHADVKKVLHSRINPNKFIYHSHHQNYI